MCKAKTENCRLQSPQEDAEDATPACDVCDVSVY